MKKTYINPTINIVNVQTQQMIAASDFGTGTKSGSEAVSRRGRNNNVWDDEEEEYEEEY